MVYKYSFQNLAAHGSPLGCFVETDILVFWKPSHFNPILTYPEFRIGQSKVFALSLKLARHFRISTSTCTGWAFFSSVTTYYNGVWHPNGISRHRKKSLRNVQQQLLGIARRQKVEFRKDMHRAVYAKPLDTSEKLKVCMQKSLRYCTRSLTQFML